MRGVRRRVTQRRLIKMRKPVASVIAAGLLLAGCASTPSPVARGVNDADGRAVATCAMVGNVSGTSGWGNLAASTGIENAKVEARERAATLGATHIVWSEVTGGYSPSVSGNAYKCKP